VTRRHFLLTVGSAASAAFIPGSAHAEDAMTWNGYGAAVVIDALGGPGNANGPRDPRIKLTAADLADVKASGLTAVNLTVNSVGSYAKDFEETLTNIAFFDGEIAAHSNLLLKVKSSTDLAEAKRSGRLGVIYGFQDGTPFGESLDRLDLFHDLGVRIVLFTYNRRNLIGDGCLEPANAGLSLLGRELVARLNERRVLIDLSHCGDRTTLESIDLSKEPVAITHTGCRAITDLPRNKTDEQLRKLADKGGVVGIYFMPYLRTSGQPMADDVIRHLEHALQICGEDHVGIGTDGTSSPVNVTPEYRKAFTDEMAERQKRGIAAPGERGDAFTFVPDLNTPRRFETLAFLLSKRGHSDNQIAKILGGNFERLFREVWG
jgi:membrane dipeptidase